MITKNRMDDRCLRWDEFYQQDEYCRQPPLDLVLRAAAQLPPGCALDLACGDGRHTLPLLDAGWEVTAVDASPAALARVDPRARRLRLDLEARDLQLEPGPWDLVINTLFLHRPLFPVICRQIRPGGRFVGVYLAQGRFGITLEELASQFGGWEILETEVTRTTVGLIARRSAVGEQGPRETP